MGKKEEMDRNKEGEKEQNGRAVGLETRSRTQDMSRTQDWY